MKIRVHTYKSMRYYGGREITTTSKEVSATFIKERADNTTLVSLDEACAGFPVGHKIAVIPANIIER